MSDWFESYGGPGTVGVVLGLFVLLGFGGLTLAVWDGRLNGDNATALANDIKSREIEIAGYNDEKIWLQKKLVKQEKEKFAKEKLTSLEKTIDAVLAKKVELERAIETEEKIAETVREKKMAYRDEYRDYERSRAAGESYDSIVLKNGRELKGVKILKVFPDRVSFATEYGSSAIDWNDLPESWSTRFQVGGGELEAFEAAAAEKRLARERHFAQLNASKAAEFKASSQKRRLSDVTLRLEELEKDIAKARTDLRNTERELANFQSRSQAKSINGKGVPTSYRNSIETAKASVSRLRLTLSQAEALELKLNNEKQTLEEALKR